MTDQKDTKISYINTAKALGIIAVVIGHINLPISDLIYLYHMPLFFFLSGYVYRDSYSLAPMSLIKKRLKSLYLPYIKYELILLILHNVFYKNHVYDITVRNISPYSLQQILINAQNILSFNGHEDLGGALWFLPALFMVNVLFCLYNYGIERFGLKSKKQLMLAGLVACSFVLGLLRTKYGIPQFLENNTALVAISIYYAGYLFRKYEQKIPFNIIYAGISFVVMILMWRYFKIKVSMVYNKYSNPTFFAISWIPGVYLHLYLSRLIDNKKNTLLNYIGSSTMPILAFQFLAFKFVTAIQVYLWNLAPIKLATFPVLETGHGWWVIYAIAGIFIPLLGKYLCDKTYLLITKNVLRSNILKQDM